jgi:hypothetical protein
LLQPQEALLLEEPLLLWRHHLPHLLAECGIVAAISMAQVKTAVDVPSKIAEFAQGITRPARVIHHKSPL